MSFWIILVVLIIASLIYRAVLNYSRLRKVNSLQELFETEHNKFIEESEIALSLFKDAGLKDAGIPVTIESDLVLRTPIQDIPQYQQRTISLFDNLTFNHKDIRPAVRGLFLKSKGVFRHQLKESLNPLFWIQYTLTLPTHFFEYLGLNKDKLIIKLIQVFYWILGIVKILYDVKLIGLHFKI